MKNLPTFRQLRFLVAVVDRCHFGKAAEDCFVSQSTLSAGVVPLQPGGRFRISDCPYIYKQRQILLCGGQTPNGLLDQQFWRCTN